MLSIKLEKNSNNFEKVKSCLNPTVEELRTDYEFGRKPILLKKVADQWPAISKWTLDYFHENFGEEIVNGRKVINGNHELQKFKLSEYLDIAFNKNISPEENATAYYLMDCQIHLGTSMEFDYQVPGYLKCWYKKIPREKRKHNLSWLYIGAANTFSGIHLDVWNTSAWNTVISGKKLWYFFPPNQEEFLYEGKVNPFEPDLDKFPDFIHAKPIISIQRPGEMIYTPSSWWHAVYNLESGISITENFINETNIDYVIENFKNNDRNKAISSLKKIARQHDFIVK